MLPQSMLGVSHRIPRKIKITVYRLQISAFVPKISKFEKGVKYANERAENSKTQPNMASSILLELSRLMCS